MDDWHFEIRDNLVYAVKALKEIGPHFYDYKVVMDKETFIKCYKKWILEEGEE